MGTRESVSEKLGRKNVQEIQERMRRYRHL